VLSALFLATQLVAMAHDAVAVHVVCPEHGELVHGELVHGELVHGEQIYAAGDGADAESSGLNAVTASAHDDGCGFLSASPLAKAGVDRPIATGAELAPIQVLGFDASSAVAHEDILTFAPKASPPRSRSA
jgi:hypothetical protein